MDDLEIRAIATINEVLVSIEDQEIRKRVLRWANDKFGYTTSQQTGAIQKASRPTIELTEAQDGEIPGIARLSEDGGIRLTIRDLKASSAMDAAIRLTLITIRAYQILTGRKTVSSKNILVPQLKNWRIYDGNTRAALARHKGIIRNGDELELDMHARNDAERYMNEVNDASMEGKWNAGGVKRNRKKEA